MIDKKIAKFSTTFYLSSTLWKGTPEEVPLSSRLSYNPETVVASPSSSLPPGITGDLSHFSSPRASFFEQRDCPNRQSRIRTLMPGDGQSPPPPPPLFRRDTFFSFFLFLLAGPLFPFFLRSRKRQARPSLSFSRLFVTLFSGLFFSPRCPDDTRCTRKPPPFVLTVGKTPPFSSMAISFLLGRLHCTSLFR